MRGQNGACCRVLSEAEDKEGRKAGRGCGHSRHCNIARLSHCGVQTSEDLKSMVSASHILDRILVLEMVRVTEAAAIAASNLIGRGDAKAADSAAVEAMRAAFLAIVIVRSEERVGGNGCGSTFRS